jgi:hypothetical protein
MGMGPQGMVGGEARLGLAPLGARATLASIGQCTDVGGVVFEPCEWAPVIRATSVPASGPCARQAPVASPGAALAGVERRAHVPGIGSPPGRRQARAAGFEVAERAVAAALGDAALLAGGQELLFARRSPLRGREATAVAAAVRKRHRKGRARLPDFVSQGQREAHKLDGEVDALIPLLPASVIAPMLGGARGIAQTAVEGRAERLRKKLSARAGACGERVARTRRLISTVRTHAAIELGLPSPERDAAVFPVSTALGHDLIAAAQRRGGQAGHTLREDLKRAAAVCGEALVELDPAGWECAAPKPRTGGGRKAGTLPIAAKCQLEHFAAGGLPREITGEARVAAEFYARSCLCGGVDQAVRVGEGVRVDMSPDQDDPDGIMYGIAYMGKDGAPMEVCAPAEGILGEYEWWPEHLRAMAVLGQTFPAWVRERGSGGSILKAGALRPFVAEAAHVRQAFQELLTLGPVAYTPDEMNSMRLRGHSVHATLPEWAAAIGETPIFPGVQLSQELALGFTDGDVDATGNWLRNQTARNEASEAEAARAAPAAQARRAAARAAVPGRAATRGTMRVYYGHGGALGNRVGQRFKLLRVRQRLVHIVRAVLGARDWRSLPRGQKDLELLRSSD